MDAFHRREIIIKRRPAVVVVKKDSRKGEEITTKGRASSGSMRKSLSDRCKSFKGIPARGNDWCVQSQLLSKERLFCFSMPYRLMATFFLSFLFPPKKKFAAPSISVPYVVQCCCTYIVCFNTLLSYL